MSKKVFGPARCAEQSIPRMTRATVRRLVRCHKGVLVNQLCTTVPKCTCFTKRIEPGIEVPLALRDNGTRKYAILTLSKIEVVCLARVPWVCHKIVGASILRQSSKRFEGRGDAKLIRGPLLPGRHHYHRMPMWPDVPQRTMLLACLVAHAGWRTPSH